VTEHDLVEHFPALDALGVCSSAFIKRIPGIAVDRDKAEALKQLEEAHAKIRRQLALEGLALVIAEQVHGNKIAVIDRPVSADKTFSGCDGFIANQRGLLLGIYVADCCAVYIVDRRTPAIGLVHSGKKGTELAIAGLAIDQMQAHFGSEPADLVVQLSPCIRPPHYEIDFAAQVVEQCRARGVKHIHDSGICTACDLNSYYSYRAEKGRTGRMLALLALT
jgi:polyphenol oxidase